MSTPRRDSVAAAPAAELDGRLLVFDAHVDSLQLALDLGQDLGVRSCGQLDLPRGRRGGLGSVVFVAWVDPSYAERGAAHERTSQLLDAYDGLVSAHPAAVRRVGNGVELQEAHAQGCIAAIAGIEGGHSIEEDLAKLEGFFERGVRVMTLVWNNHLSWVRSCQDGATATTPAGLSGFGRDVVRTMNELGMLVDLSHAGRQSFHDALDCSSAPVIASHSGCHALHAHPRNLDDDQLRALRDNGGVVGIVFCTPFLDAEARRLEGLARASQGYKALAAEHESETALFVAQGDYMQANVAALAMERVIDHIVHAVEICGIEHVGIGSDFDGIQRRPVGLEDASCYGNLARALRARGFDASAIEGLLGRNMERVFARATGQGTRASKSVSAAS